LDESLTRAKETQANEFLRTVILDGWIKQEESR
jgi:hypothetical protein